MYMKCRMIRSLDSSIIYIVRAGMRTEDPDARASGVKIATIKQSPCASTTTGVEISTTKQSLCSFMASGVGISTTKQSLRTFMPSGLQEYPLLQNKNSLCGYFSPPNKVFGWNERHLTTERMKVLRPTVAPSPAMLQPYAYGA